MGGADPAPDLEHPAPPAALRELAGLALILGVTLLLNRLADLLGTSWAGLLLPNLWLLLASARWGRGRLALGAGRHVGAACGLSLAACAGVVASGLAGPAGAAPLDAAALGRGLLLVALVPLAEELFFRGLLLDHLTRTHGRPAAIVLVSALFGFLHHPQGLFPHMAALSLVLSTVAALSGSLRWPVLLHAAWNAAAFLAPARGGEGRTALTLGVAAALAGASLLACARRTSGAAR